MNNLSSSGPEVFKFLFQRRQFLRFIFYAVALRFEFLDLSRSFFKVILKTSLFRRQHDFTPAAKWVTLDNVIQYSDGAGHRSLSRFRVCNAL